jgi:hypothetical protein
MSDLENDRRYPPTGDLLKKMEAMFCGNDGELKLYFYNLAGLGRQEVPPDMAEHLRSNFSSRRLVRMLMQIDIQAAGSTDDENDYFEIKKAIEKIAARKGIKLLEPDSFEPVTE